MNTKFCSKCKVDEPISNFRRRGYYQDGSINYHSACKIYEQEYSKKYYEQHKEDKANYYINNKKILNEQNAQWLKNNPEYRKKWREDNKEEIKIYHKLYSCIHREEINKRKREYNKKYYADKIQKDP